MPVNNSIFKKIRKYSFIIVITVIAVVTVIIGAGLYVIRQNVITVNNNLGISAANDAKQSLIKQSEETLLRLVESKASVSDEKFSSIADHIDIISHAATNIRSNPGEYSRRSISYPDTSNTEGLVTVMVQISDNTNYADVSGEIGLMANIKDLLLAVQINNDSVGTTYIGTEAGITICADPDSAQKTPYFNCRTRLWYINAKEANKLIWTDVFEDYLGRGLAITCAKPFHDYNGNVAGVAGMGFFLKTLNDVVIGANIGETGDSFLLNEKGEIIISGNPERNGEDQITRENLFNNSAFPRETAERIISGKTGIEQIKLDGVEKFIAYCGLTAIPWSFVVVINVDEVLAPALHMEENIINLKQTALDSIGNVIMIIAVSTGFVLLFIIFGTFFVANRLAISLTNPINKLTEDAALIGSGKLDHALDINTGDELEILSDAFNKMISSIKMISAEKDFAEQSSRYKSSFLANMSHEIRTPMNAILGIAEIQLQNNSNSPDAADAFHKIYESGDLLLNIINDILDLSKIEAGKLELIPCDYDITSLINDTVHLNRLRYESKPVKFNVHVDENTPLNLSGDVLRIKQVLNNILSNAFKYTDTGSIDFFVSSEITDIENAVIVFRVSDTGQGMTKDQIDNLYNEYSRFNLETNRSVVGTGLGMSITKHLLDLMNGEITVESTPGKGSVFNVKIPQKRINQNVCGAVLAEKLKHFHFANSAITKKTLFMREYMPYGSVLAVDDVESNIYVIKGMLAPYGLKIDTAFNGMEAINKIKDGNTYDIIFMDHMMPKMDGIEAVKIIRDMGYTSYIIALTANALIGQEEMFLQNGFDGFISKPIDSRELNYCLNEFIRNKKPAEVIENARLEKRQKFADTENDSGISVFFLQDANNTVNILEKLMNNYGSFNNEEKTLYTTTVHGIKSALANIGETELSGVALKLEEAGRENNTELIFTETPAFLDAIKFLIKKITPDTEINDVEIFAADAYFLKEKLQEIKILCENFNKKAAKKTLNELKQKTWPSHIKAALDNIATLLLHSDFNKAAEAARQAALP